MLYFFRGELIELNCRSIPNFLALGTSDVRGFFLYLVITMPSAKISIC